MIRKLPVTEVTTEALLRFNQPDVCAVGVPGGGGVATAADMALFYQALLHDPLGMWKPEVLSDVTSTVRNSFPDFMGVPANRTRGLIVKGDDERSGIARHGPHRFRACVRAQRCGRPDRVGRSGNRSLVLLSHQRHRRARAAPVAAQCRDRESSRELFAMTFSFLAPNPMKEP